MAGFVMANGSLSSTSGGEGEIRRKIVEADLVDCIVALPAQLFYTTGIPVCLWFLSREKTRNPRRADGPRGREADPWRDRSGEVLFIDARKLGTMETRTLRVLTGAEPGEQVEETSDPRPDTDIGRIVTAYRRWRGERAPAWWDEGEHGAWAYEDVPGFSKSATLDEIAGHGHVLTPGRYVGAEALEDDGVPFEEKFPRLVAELEECFAEGERLTSLVRDRVQLIEVVDD